MFYREMQMWELNLTWYFMFSGFCHFQPLDLSPSFSTSGGKNIPRDLVTRNFLNLNEFWEFVKMCETSPKVNIGKFLRVLVSPHRHWTLEPEHTWQKAKTNIFSQFNYLDYQQERMCSFYQEQSLVAKPPGKKLKFLAEKVARNKAR